MSLRRRDGWALPGNRWDLLDGLEPDSPPAVSVIVSHYEQPAQLKRTLRAIGRQRYPAELVEVIVVDDGSRQPPRVPDSVTLLRQDDLGFRLAAARNRGAAAATGDVLVFLDADTSPEPDYLRRLVRLPALSWDAVTVGRRRHADLASLSGETDVEVSGPQHELPEPAWLREAYRASGDLLRIDHRSYRYVIGAVIACTRRFFDETGGFDETFTSYGGEDWEWAYRAWLNGAVLAHVPDAVAWHDGPDSAGRGASVTLKNTEAMRLAELIPVPGSRPLALAARYVDIAIRAPLQGATVGQRFVTLDSVLAALPGAVVLTPDVAHSFVRFDRVRIEVVVEHPLRVDPGALDAAIAAVDDDAFAEIVLRAPDGGPLLRLISRRAAARQARWGGDALLPSLDRAAAGVRALTNEVDVEAYLGGW